MKKLFLFVLLSIFCISTFAQSTNTPTYVVVGGYVDRTYICLNTADGRLWYIFAPENPKFVSTEVISEPLLPEGEEPVPGRFAAFVKMDEHIIVYDTVNGRTWYIKYHANEHKASIVPLNFDESPEK